MAPRTYRFGAFELDEPRFELRRAGERVELQPKALDLMLYLLSHRDRVVSKAELLKQLWPDVVVSEASLSKAVSSARRALGDSGGQQRCIETVRGRGFRFLARVEEHAASRAAAAEAAGDHTPPTFDADRGFVGREAVLSAIADALAAADRGTGRVILLAGEAGIGKTRTAHEAAARARAAGARVLTGWCPEGEGTPALWPWLQVLRQLVEDADPGPLTAGLGEGVADLAALLPALRERLSDLGAAAPIDPAQARFRLFDTAGAILTRAARERVHLLVLDDVHWADRASLLLLDFLSHVIAAARIALVVTYREDELTPADALADLSRGPAGRPLTLDGLSCGEVARLLEVELGRPVEASVAAAIHERTEGNPFFVKELARGIAAHPAPDPAPPLGAAAALPAGIRELLRRRLERLTPPCAEVLLIAAAMGRDVDVALVAAVAGLAPDALLERLDEARAAHLLRAGPAGYSFAHALVREALLDRIPAAERSRLHRRIGEALEARHRDDLEPHLARLALHFCEGALSGAGERAVAYARRAGDRAAALLAPDEAASHYGRALDVHALLALPDDRERCELLLALGEAQMRSGQRHEGRETLRRAADRARSLGAAELLGRAALASGGLELAPSGGVHDPELIALLEDALAMLPASDSTLRVRLLVRLSIALCWTRLDRSAELVQEAVTAARRLGEPAALAYALYTHRWSLLSPTDLEARLADGDEMLELGRRSGRRELQLAARSCRFMDLIELGRIAEADRELLAYDRLTAQVGVPRYRWRAGVYRTLRVLLEGRFAEAEAMALQAHADEQRFQPEDAGAVLGMQLITIRREQGRAGELELVLRSIVDRFPAIPTWRIALALAHAEMGRLVDARDGFEAFAVDDFRAVPRDAFWIVCTVALAEVCCLLGDAARAAVLYEALNPYTPRAVMIAAGVACWGALDRFVGALAVTAGNWEAAQRHLEAALRMNTRIGARPWLGWTHYDLARLQLGRAQRGEARAHLDRARDIAATLGMARLAARAAELPSG